MTDAERQEIIDAAHVETEYEAKIAAVRAVLEREPMLAGARADFDRMAGRFIAELRIKGFEVRKA